MVTNAKRKASRIVKPKKGGRRPGGPGGDSRDQHAKEDLTDQVAYLMNRNLPRRQIAVAMGKFLQLKGMQETDEPMPIGTVDDYRRRAEEMWAEQARLTRRKARELQRRRLLGSLMKAEGDARHRDAIRLEFLLMKIDGTEMPKEIRLGGTGGGGEGGGAPGAPIPIELTIPKSTPTSDDLRRELVGLLAKSKGGAKLAAALSDED